MLSKVPTFYRVDDHHTRNGTAHFHVLRCHRTKTDFQKLNGATVF